ncbi:MAG: SUMF1/EgtB/PvdO family nonheme iron enzyme [Candidatus Thiodiazotropha sp.]
MEQRQSSVFRVFIGSPGDVADLRESAFDIIRRLSEDRWRPAGLSVEGYGWDVNHYPKLVNHPPQVNITESLPEMAEYDLCLFILSTRLGTPLDGDNFPPLPDGRQPSGTEYEFHQALERTRLGDGQPAVLVYHLPRAPDISLDSSAEQQQESFTQFQRVQSFIKSITENAEGAFVGDLFRFETEEQFRDQLTNDLKALIDQRLPEQGPPQDKAKPDVAQVPKAYLRWLQRQLPDLSLKGLNPKTAIPVRLPDIYVPALLMARHRSPDDNERQGESGREPGESLELLLTRLERESLYVSGAPGSGKTSFCLWLCWLFNEGRLPSHEIETPEAFRETLPVELLTRLPILCRLRDFWGHMACQKDGDWSQAQLEEGLARWLDTKAPDGLSGDGFLHWLKAGRCLLILDGFDEVPIRHEAAAGISYPHAILLSGLASALGPWIDAGNRILLTSRPYGLRDDERRRLGLEENPLQPLPAGLQQTFIQRWYRTSHGRKGSETAESLWDHLSERQDAWLEDLTRSPLLLTALCVKFAESMQLPTDQHELFDAVVENTLYNRYRDDASELLPVRRRLEAVAWGMHSGETLGMEVTCPVAEISNDQVDLLLAKRAELNPMSEAGLLTTAQRRDELLTRTGLLLPQGEESAGFYHLTFQDFFAAEHSLHDPQSDVPQLLRDHATDPRWHPMLLFLLSGMIRSSNGMDTPLRLFGDILRPRLSSGSLAQEPLPAILWGRCLELADTRVKTLGALGEEFFNACLDALRQVEDPQQRLHLFDSLGRLGLDRRPGVGLDEQGLPDIDWVEIPAGSFIYGVNKTIQTLELDRYYISRYPITNIQFQVFIDAGGYEIETLWRDIRHVAPTDGRWKVSNRPRESVSWFEAMAFCRWLSGACDRPVRLPTEQEWEKAAKGVDGRNFPWGGYYKKGIANVDERLITKGLYNLDQTSTVGLYPQGASQYGVFDIAGNLWEWCMNKFLEPTNYSVDITYDDRVLRGGSWISAPGFTHSAYRNLGDPDGQNSDVGFRVLSSDPL